jgi:hypothetical protein
MASLCFDPGSATHEPQSLTNGSLRREVCNKITFPCAHCLILHARAIELTTADGLHIIYIVVNLNALPPAHSDHRRTIRPLKPTSSSLTILHAHHMHLTVSLCTSKYNSFHHGPSNNDTDSGIDESSQFHAKLKQI